MYIFKLAKWSCITIPYQIVFICSWIIGILKCQSENILWHYLYNLLAVYVIQSSDSLLYLLYIAILDIYNVLLYRVD